MFFSRNPTRAPAPPTELSERALAALARAFGVGVARLRNGCRMMHYHDWSADPFTRGAYSYPGLGGVEGARMLSMPVDDSPIDPGILTVLGEEIMPGWSATARPARLWQLGPRSCLRTSSQVHHNALLGRRPRELLHYRWQGSLL
jgi:hypothetical protein